MIDAIIRGIKKLFFGESEEISMPGEYISIEWNPLALEKGITTDFAKEIHLYGEGNKPRVFPYLRSLLAHLHLKGKIPYMDNTTKEIAPEVEADVNVGDYEYVE